MVHRLALLFGAVGAAAVLALALNLGGIFSAAPTAADVATVVPAATDQPVAAAPDAPKTVIDKVYVEPTPKAPVIHVNKPPRNTAPAPTVTQPRGEAEREHERGDRGERGDD